MDPAGSRRWWALGAVMLAVLAVSLDLTVLSVALPTLSKAFNASESDLQWFSSGYALVLAAAMLPAGLIGDRYGRKKVMLFSLALFAIGSLSCAWSQSAAQFIAARVLLGFAGAGLIVMAISALTVLFSEEERPKAIGIWALANMIALPIGPILGGWLLYHYWWGWVFLINVPVAILGFVAVASFVPESSSSLHPSIDLPGVFSSSTGLAAITYGLIEVGKRGWGSRETLVTLSVGIVLILIFIYWQRILGRRPGGQPLLDLGLFHSASFTWGVVLITVLTLALVGLLFTMPQYFQGVLGTNAEGSGIRLLPVVAGLMVGLLPARKLGNRIGAKLTVALGFAILGTGLALGAATTALSGEGFTVLWMTIVGIGTGLTMVTAASAALVELSEEQAGVGSGALQALKNTGAPLGSAILGSALASAYISHLDLGGLPPIYAQAARQSIFGGVAVAHGLNSAVLLSSVKAAFIHGMDVALLVSAGFALVGAVLSLIFLPGHPLHASEKSFELRGRDGHDGS
ncbi:MAG: MFS transporter [Actinomycetota bacterium]|nr:MAG: MFS transporter [Actinomycetota bacterium]